MGKFSALPAVLVRAFSVAVVMVLTISDQSLAMQESVIPAELRYEIIKESTFGSDRRSLDVRLSQKVDEAALEALAYKLRDQGREAYARTFIVYYLPGMEVDAGGWATTHFRPDLQVRILGPRLGSGSSAQIASQCSDTGGIGTWEYSGPDSYGGLYTLVKRKYGQRVEYFLERVHSDESVSTEKLVRRQGLRYEELGNTSGEYYLVHLDRLELHNAEGLLFAAPSTHALEPCDGVVERVVAGTVIGTWESNRPGIFGGTYLLMKSGATYSLTQAFSDGSTRTEYLRKQSSQLGLRLKEPGNKHGEFYIIRNGRLELYDPEGLVFTALEIPDDD